LIVLRKQSHFGGVVVKAGLSQGNGLEIQFGTFRRFPRGRLKP